MKSVHFALLLALALAMAGNLSAQARPAPHSGTSASYKSGFSSQKSNSAHSRPTAPAADRHSGPGAFGKAAGSPASAQPQRNTSQMTRDLDQSGSQANALKTLDARRAAGSAPPPLPPSNDTAMRPQQASIPSQPQYQPPYQPPPYQAPIYQQPSNGLMHGLLGFMLGRAISQSNQPVSYPTVNAGHATSQPGGQANAPADNGMLAGMPGLATPAPVVVATAPAAPVPAAFGASVLRWFVWLAVLGVMAWAAVYAVRKLRRLRTANARAYSFERN